MRIRAISTLEPPGLKRKLQPGEEIDVSEDYGIRVLNSRHAVAVASRPTDRAEKRPKASAERR